MIAHNNIVDFERVCITFGQCQSVGVAMFDYALSM